MASASSQAFGNLLASNFQGFSGGLNKDWSAAFKTPFDSIQTLQIKPETTSGLTGGLNSYMTPDFEAIQKIEDPNARTMLMMEYIADRRAQKDIENLPNTLKTIRDQQYADELRASPLKFQQLVAANLLKTISNLPGQIASAGQMYGQEAATAFGKQTQNFQAPQVVKYF